MFAGMAVLLILAAFGVQLLFCFLAGKRWVQWISMAVILAGALAAWLIRAVVRYIKKQRK